MVCEKVYSQDINVGATTSSFAVGRSLAGPDEYSNGLIDNLKVYCRVLSENEIGVIAATQPIRRNSGNFHLTFVQGTHQWSVEFEDHQKPSHLEFFSLQGGRIDLQPISSSTKTIWLPGLPPGLYIIKAPGFPSQKWLLTK